MMRQGFEKAKPELLQKTKSKKFIEFMADSTFIDYSGGDTSQGYFSLDTLHNRIYLRETDASVEPYVLTYRFIGQSLVVSYASRKDPDWESAMQVWLRRL